MAISVIIEPSKSDSKAIRREFERLQKAGRDLRRPLGRTGLFIRRQAQRALRSRPRDWGPGTGRLAKSLAMRLDAMSVTVGSNLVYAAIQQKGGKVRPKGHKYLALPVQAQLRRRGVWPRDLPKDSMRFVPNAAIRIGSHSWHGPALVRARVVEIETSADGAGVKGQTRRRRRPVGRADEVMFALVKRVRIRGKEYLTFGRPARAFLLQETRRHYTDGAP